MAMHMYVCITHKRVIFSRMYVIYLCEWNVNDNLCNSELSSGSTRQYIPEDNWTSYSPPWELKSHRTYVGLTVVTEKKRHCCVCILSLFKRCPFRFSAGLPVILRISLWFSWSFEPDVQAFEVGHNHFLPHSHVFTPNVVIQWLKLQLRIWEVLGLNLGPETVYPDWGFSWVVFFNASRQLLGYYLKN
jgi:hypothetical protein